MGNNENWIRHIVHKNKKTKNSHKVRRNVKFTKKTKWQELVENKMTHKVLQPYNICSLQNILL